ncbi:MAG: hypothetical protein GKR98_04425 [Boseongicola sp.]|nr:MAG: hypothetical protein GKR98_04425 [Boseongicola sp.]
MPHQNRVLSTSEIIRHPARGLFMGNRGILHDEHQQIGKPRWRHKAWIICNLTHKDWHREIMQPGNYTELFFLDEAVALAAGHRPCALCRRSAYNDFLTAADHIDPVRHFDDHLHNARAIPRKFTQRRHTTSITDLPDYTIIFENAPKLILGNHLREVRPDGYGPPKPRPRSGSVTVLTPEPTIKALRNGYRPMLHPSARG